MNKSFYLSQPDINLCDKYYLLHWEGEYLRNSLILDEITQELYLEHQNVRYKVRPMQQGYKLDSQYKLSFRRLIGEQEGYVVIKLLYLKDTK